MNKEELEKLKDPIFVNFNLLKVLGEIKSLLKNTNEILILQYELLSSNKEPKKVEDKEGVL